MTVIKVLLALVLAVLVLLLGLVAATVWRSDDHLHARLERDGSQYFGAAVTVEALDLGLRRATGSLRGVEIGNPAGFLVHGPRAIRIESIDIEFDPRASSPGSLAIRRVTLAGVTVGAIVRGPGNSNVHTLVRNLDHARQRADLVHDEDREALEVFIEGLAMVDAEASAIGELSRRSFPVPLADLHLTGVGHGPDGARIDAILRAVLHPVAAAIDEVAVAQRLTRAPLPFRQQLPERVDVDLLEHPGFAIGILGRE